ncbi:MAG: aldose 1-epimerase [Alphaproteobacteria bacterium]|nr:aldose 1-epimerase [Alphaproteobacteria bacterium]
MTLLSLRAGRLALDLAPQAGGSIAGLSVDGVGEVLRPMTVEAAASQCGSEAACYPLVPFSNRIAEGRLAFDGQERRLAANWPGQRHPMHGEGWARSWRVARRGGDVAELIHEHDGVTGWPFRYRARQTFQLADDALSVGMMLENLEPRVVPGGIGLHPFFVRDDDTELAFQAASVWLADAELLPTERAAVPSRWDYAAPRRVQSGLDNCFEGWDGSASIVWPRRGLRLTLQASLPFRHLVVYTPPDRPYFCVEPVSHANGKVGEALLAPGAALAGDVVFRLSAL